MRTTLPDARPYVEAYQREFQAERLPGYARLGAGIAFAINTAFVGLDYLSYPDHFEHFLGLRLLLNGLFVGVYVYGSEHAPRASIWSICLALGAAMLAMIFATGGPESRYFAGLILLFVAMGVVLPLSGWEAAGICGAILAPFLASPWLHGGELDWAIFRIHAVFLLSAAGESVASCAYLERMRFKDFRQRMALQEARDHLEGLDKAKSRFTANVHHELRTPLALTLAPIEGMLAGEFGSISDVQRQYLRTAETNANRLLKLINDLLDLAKLEDEQLELHRTSIDPAEVVERLVEGACPLAERKGVELEVDCARELGLIHADPDALEKIVVNLVGNALKFTDAGGRVCVSLQPDREQGGVMLRVADSGVGIPPDQLERVFDRFAQIDTSSTRRHGGTGIGLSLCRELAELHGGRIWAESEGEGRGTTMCVWIPAGERASAVGADDDAENAVATDALGARRAFDGLEAEVEIDPPSPVEGAAAADAGREAVTGASDHGEPDEDAPELVIADDNGDMRELLQHLLGREYRVRLARNGREALEAVRERAPDLVLTDVTAGIPVVLLTSKAERSMKIEGLELGADDYVTKPFHARELQARIRSLVRLRRLQAEVEDRNAKLKAAMCRVQTALAELKETQVQLVQHERLAVVGELAAGVAHEANNPLNFATNAMRAFLSSLEDVEAVAHEIVGLRDGTADGVGPALEKLRRTCEEREFDDSLESLRELAVIIDEGLTRTAKLVGDLRDFAGRRSSDHETVDLRAGVDSTLRLMSQALRDAEVEVEVEASPDLPFVVGDARALNQVVLNLLKNAMHAMKGRPGTIAIGMTGSDDEAVIRIRDEGHGIPEEIRGEIFEPFRTTKRVGEGTGLGLSISRRILAEHGGRLDLLESSERGTTFELRIPVED